MYKKKSLSNKRRVLVGEASAQARPVLLTLRDKGQLRAAHLIRCSDIHSVEIEL